MVVRNASLLAAYQRIFLDYSFYLYGMGQLLASGEPYTWRQVRAVLRGVA